MYVAFTMADMVCVLCHCTVYWLCVYCNSPPDALTSQLRTYVCMCMHVVRTYM
jgi:hypothetical protein